MRSHRPTRRRLLPYVLLTLALAGCSTQRAVDVVPEVRVERVAVPAALRACRPPEGLSAGQTQADIGRDLVTITDAYVGCAALHDRLVAEIERRP